ncbi:MAG: hypothetical protein KGL39_49535, partial [Patescibacteria group bacterium]|nr:hypothetical protein [Patescibacteria group bacterium]
MKISAKPRQAVEGPAIALLLPTRGNPTIETVQCLQNMDGYRTAILPAARMDVVKARNKLASDVKKICEKAPFIPKGGWLALWVDDDAFWRPGTVKQLVTKLLDDKDIDVIAGWFSGRSAFSNPKAFYANGNWPSIGQDCQVGDVVEVARVGFHFVL